MSFNEVRYLEKGIKYAEELINLSQDLGNNDYLRAGYFIKGTKERLIGNLDEALKAYIKSAEIARETNHLTGEGDAYGAIGDTYSTANHHANAKDYYNKAINILRKTNDSINLASAIYNAGDEFRKIKRYDSALLYFNEAKVIFERSNHQSGIGYSLGGIGMVYASTGKNNLAEKNINQAIGMLEKAEDYYPICEFLISMADVYLDKGDDQTALYYALRSMHLAERFKLKEQISDASLKLSEIYENAGNTDAALTYHKKYMVYRDSVNNLKTVEAMADLRTNFEVSQKQIEVDLLKQQKQSKQKLNVALGIILGLALLILGILIRNYRQKQKAYKKLELQKQETDRLRAKAEHTLQELQLTQKQLIQSAKMASLGELTAGIAHEIQNPLNFVNNFSELSVDMLDELKDADQAKADEIINDLAGNLKKINYHGKRADSIIKGMLQHSKASTGKKEPTDINALAEECLRLSYHGLRAKDKEFNAVFRTKFDESIGKIEVIPQDIGRVLLNLFNNAFYAVNEKKKEGNSDYEPFVLVSTKKVGQIVELSIRDNGTGIPQKLLDKIFQPFFTTKPSGIGTGLGLSLSYDVINAHGGELKVDTKEGEFTEFIIQLPRRGIEV